MECGTDALWIYGKDLRGLPLTRRKRALTGLVPATTTVLPLCVGHRIPRHVSQAGLQDATR